MVNSKEPHLTSHTCLQSKQNVFPDRFYIPIISRQGKFYAFFH